ncbi:MAG TPA: hypothetical protein VLX12_09205 [Syntrophorhabdales bacterium]|nr:hypothetical protein [Syntrophorhabdales bacterium]
MLIVGDLSDAASQGHDLFLVIIFFIDSPHGVRNQGQSGRY